MNLASIRTLILATAALASLTPPTRADNVADFYRGKRISLVIGFGSGGGYDLYARLLGRFIGAHIPGNPAVVPQNMPGAGSRSAANWLYTIAPKDGTVIACPEPSYADRSGAQTTGRAVRSTEIQLDR